MTEMRGRKRRGRYLSEDEPRHHFLAPDHGIWHHFTILLKNYTENEGEHDMDAGAK